MKNWEKYETEITELGLEAFALNKSGEIVDCAVIDCDNCRFYRSEGKCGIVSAKWLYEEYKEPKPKLTKEDFILLNSLEYPMGMTIRRDAEGELYLSTYVISVGLKKHMFSFIPPGQEYEVTELKELEVEGR